MNPRIPKMYRLCYLTLKLFNESHTMIFSDKLTKMPIVDLQPCLANFSEWPLLVQFVKFKKIFISKLFIPWNILNVAIKASRNLLVPIVENKILSFANSQ